MASDAYAAVMGRELATVEITAATVPSTSVSPGWWRARQPRRAVGPSLAVASISALFAVIGLALWLGRPAETETGAAAPSSIPASANPTPQSSIPTEPAPPPIAVTPVAGQPCNPAVDNNTFADDGTPLACLPTGGRIANWIPAQPPAAKPQANNGQPAQGNSGNNNSGNEDSDNADSGHGNDKQGHGKPGHPRPGQHDN
jgi:serine/threonine-protein kinase